MPSSHYTLHMQINDAQVVALNFPLAYVKDEIHSICIAYGDCVSIYNEYVFPDGYTIFFVLNTLKKIYPAFESFMYDFTMTNKAGDSVNLLNFVV